jgi:hypothetical protein
MTKGDIHRIYRNMSPQDQRAFERWLKANVVVASVFAAGFIAMALAGADALGPVTPRPKVPSPRPDR